MKRFLMYGISKSLLIKIIIALLILLGVKDVFAQDFDVTTKITAPTCSGSNCSGGHYTGLETYNSGSQNVYAVKTRYNGRLATMKFNIPLSGITNWPDGSCFSTGDVIYRLILEMDTNDWNNKFARPFISNGSNGSNWATSSVVFVSYKKIYVDFKIPNSNTCEDFIYVYLQSTSQSSTTITQISNWQLQKVNLSVTWPSSGGSGSGGSGSNDIINNNNQNTSDIINNNNQNTQSIIDNQNELLGDCVKNLMDNNLILSVQNVTQNGNSFTQINADTNPTLVLMAQGYNSSSYVDTLARTDITNNGYYTLSFTKTSSFNVIYYKLNGYSYDTGLKIDVSSLENDKTYYIKSEFTNTSQGSIKFRNLMITNKNIDGFIAWGSQFCTSKLDNTTNAINDLNDTMKDESEPVIDLDIDIDTNSPVSDLLTMPLTILNKIFDITDDSCQPYVLPFDFFGGNNTLTLPCINLQQRLGNNVYNILDTLLCFFIAYNIGLMCISIYENITSLNDSFQSLYSPRHGVGGRTERGEMEGRYD